MVYFGTVDAHLVALNAATGAVRWDVTVADYTKGYSITVPLAITRRPAHPESEHSLRPTGDSK